MSTVIYNIPTNTALGMDALAEITPAATFIESRQRLGHSGKLMTLGLHFFYIKQAAPRPSEQAHGTRLALLLRLQRDNSSVAIYLGRCPRLYTSALSARAVHAGLRMGFVENVGTVVDVLGGRH